MQQTNVLEYLEKTVLRVPDKLAFSDGQEGLNFAQVSHDSRAIGSYLASKGYYNEPVVVFMRKHPKCIPGFFGCVYGSVKICCVRPLRIPLRSCKFYLF